ncbi:MULTISPECIES: hypothetical protein [unclassified Gilliamella]|uniref:hypothetical protein n=1 Tax=unclassified Gilliamella TaxID=2685620 RepID=UPI00080E13AC|nr:hypothetical protein [Gilliamella apicola]OCG34789.1 hypothetical protein A9G32_08515 [Gilliamella apicola]OCG47681.1 hypothetical protein A9G26_11220 [Gilliamella apicola]OCG50640.1 hypothetical protein A9G27_01195 [Gilliamella apicola]
MQNFKTILDAAIKARNHAISNSMLDSAISTHKSDARMTEYKVRCATTLIRYLTKPSMSLWDSNSKLKEYLATNQLL